MSIQIKKMLSIPSGKVNEDAIGRKEKLFWVIDGATPIKNSGFFSKNDAAWISSIISQELSKTEDTSKSSLRTIMIDISSRLKLMVDETFPGWEDNLEKSDLPSYAIALIRISENKLEYLILGDCFIVKKKKKKIKIITDERIKKVTNKTLYALHGSDIELKKQLKENRESMNTPQGYWIGDITGIAYNHSIEGQLSIDSTCELILCTDGFARIVDVYALMGWSDIFSHDVELIASQIRAIENDDEEKIVFPRVKKSDDISVIKLNIERTYHSLI